MPPYPPQFSDEGAKPLLTLFGGTNEPSRRRASIGNEDDTDLGTVALAPNKDGHSLPRFCFNPSAKVRGTSLLGSRAIRVSIALGPSFKARDRLPNDELSSDSATRADPQGPDC